VGERLIRSPGFADRQLGYVCQMSDDTADPYAADPFTVEPEVADGPHERERESAQTDESRFERELDADRAERHAAAKKLKNDEPPRTK